MIDPVMLQGRATKSRIRQAHGDSTIPIVQQFTHSQKC
jgi:hypothetical protein